MEISKELLSEVLDTPVENCRVNCKWIIYNECLNKDEFGYINIYELAHKCKEWALSKGYMMKIENHYSNSVQIQLRKNASNSKYLEPWRKTFKSEPKAIFKACEWILKEIKK